MTNVPFRRSATYFNRLVKAANAKALMKICINEENKSKFEVAHKVDHGEVLIMNYELSKFEVDRKVDLDAVFQYIEASAKQGAVRVINWEWSTPAHIRKLLFEDQEIQKYMRANGFLYSSGPDCIEWWHAAWQPLC
jgi:hypothetical protein